MNNSDDGGIFHYFCDKYDAHAYKDMSEEEQEIYNALVEQSDVNVSNMLNEIKKRIVMGYAK